MLFGLFTDFEKALTGAQLKTILDSAIRLFPNLTRVSAYGSIKSLENK